MTPGQKYLRELQLAFYKGEARSGVDTIPDEYRASPNFPLFLESIRETTENRITPEQNIGSALKLKLMQQHVIDCCNRIGIKIDHVTVPLLGSIDSHHINARVVKVPDSDEKLIIFNDGVFKFLNLVTNAVSGSFGGALEKGWTAVHEAVAHFEPKAISEQDRQWLDKTAGYFEAYLTKGDPLLSEYHVGGVQGNMTVHINNMVIEQFVMAHEWGHLIEGHLDQGVSRRAMMASMEVELIENSIMDEFAADYHGVAICTEYLNHYKLSFERLALLDLFFWYMDTLERCISILVLGKEEPLVSQTHPPSFARNQVIWRWVEERLPQANITRYKEARDALFALYSPHYHYTAERMWQLREQGVMVAMDMY